MSCVQRMYEPFGVTITDEDECSDYPDCDDTSDARALDIYNQMVAIKGDVKRMVYLGIGGDTRWQHDTVTVTLRAVSTNTGEVLSSVTVEVSPSPSVTHSSTGCWIFTSRKNTATTAMKNL